MPAVIAAVVLLVLLIAVAAAFLWQEQRTFDDGIAVYGVDDSVAYVTARLSESARSIITAADVRRILEWDLLFLQDAGVRHDPDAPVVVGGLDAAAFAQERAYAAGYAYEPEVILEVLDLRTEYLVELGVVGPAVEGTDIEPLP